MLSKLSAIIYRVSYSVYIHILLAGLCGGVIM